MNPQCTDENYELIEILIHNFCKIILTKKDNLNVDEAKKYIDSLTLEDITVLNTENPEKNQQIRTIVLKQVAEYISSFFQTPTPSFQRPFEFDSGGTYVSFCKICNEYYQETHQRNTLPTVLSFTLQYIQEMSEHYRIFGHFYEVHSQQTSNQIIEKMAKTAEEKANEVIKNVSEKTAKDAVEKSVDEKMEEVTTKISETSVTILGIFSGIVLTVVAGLFYSSSVLENINTANFFRLLAVAALVGLVCYHLLLVMFCFIEKFRKVSKDDTKNNIVGKPSIKVLSIFISIVLIVIFVVSCVLQFVFPNSGDVSPTNQQSIVNVDENQNMTHNETNVNSQNTVETETDIENDLKNASKNKRE